jgi:hypothetical protein
MVTPHSFCVPEVEVPVPVPEPVEPEPEDVEPEPDDVEPEPEDVEPEPVEPEPEDAEPEPEPEEPELGDAEPEPESGGDEISEPELVCVAPVVRLPAFASVPLLAPPHAAARRANKNMGMKMRWARRTRRPPRFGESSSGGPGQFAKPRRPRPCPP